MKKSTQLLLVTEDKKSHLIQVTKINNGVEDDKFTIPVIDVRDGDIAREAAISQLKQTNQSKFSKPSFSVMGRSYQVSHKKL